MKHRWLWTKTLSISHLQQLEPLLKSQPKDQLQLIIWINQAIRNSRQISEMNTSIREVSQRLVSRTQTRLVLSRTRLHLKSSIQANNSLYSNRRNRWTISLYPSKTTWPKDKTRIKVQRRACRSSTSCTSSNSSSNRCSNTILSLKVQLWSANFLITRRWARVLRNAPT